MGSDGSATQAFSVEPQVWRPEKVKRLFPGGDGKTAMLTREGVFSGGRGFIKPWTKPEDLHPHACDLIFSLLARSFGLDVPRCGYVMVDKKVLAFGSPWGSRRLTAVLGPAFVSEKVEASPWSGSKASLGSIKNRSKLARLVVMDTLAINKDRYCPSGHPNFDISWGRPNWPHRNVGNLLLSGPADARTLFHPIDFGHSITYCKPLSSDIMLPSLIESEEVLGFDPEFHELVDRAAFESAIGDLSRLTYEYIESVVAKVPDGWDIGPELRSALCEFVFQRARFLKNAMMDMVIRVAPHQLNFETAEATPAQGTGKEDQ